MFNLQNGSSLIHIKVLHSPHFFSNLDGSGHIYYFFSVSNLFTIDEELFENEKKIFEKVN